MRVRDRVAGRARSLARACQRRVVEQAVDQCRAGVGHLDHRRGHGPEHYARRRAGAAFVERQVDGRAHHRDVHLGARDQPQVGVRRARRR